jgi:hypothetical protein
MRKAWRRAFCCSGPAASGAAETNKAVPRRGLADGVIELADDFGVGAGTVREVPVVFGDLRARGDFRVTLGAVVISTPSGPCHKEPDRCKATSPLSAKANSESGGPATASNGFDSAAMAGRTKAADEFTIRRRRVKDEELVIDRIGKQAHDAGRS